LEALLAAKRRVDVEGTADVAKPLVTKIEQMLGREPTPGRIVDDDAAPDSFDAAVDDHDRRRQRGERTNLSVIERRRSNEEPVEPSLLE
jgi:hypothetical protein